jgi:hypothetical protein
MPAFVQVVAQCGSDPLANLIALARIVGPAAVLEAMAATADKRPAIVAPVPRMDDERFREIDSLMRARSAGPLGSAV